MEKTYTRILTRKILITFLAFVIVLSIAMLFVRNSISKKLESISELSSNVEHNQARPGYALLLLHQAEDDFQESLINADSAKSIDYKTKLSLAFNEIDTLLKENADTVNLTSAQRSRVKFWYKKKLILSGKLYLLKHTFDSLLNVYADFNVQLEGNEEGATTNGQTNKKNTSNSADSAWGAPQKKGLIKRIREAIVNKNGNSARVLEIRHNRKETELSTERIITKNKEAYNKKLQQLQQQNVKLLDMQRALTTLNTHVINEMNQIITDIEGINYNMVNEFKEIALKSYRETTKLLNELYLVASILVLVFAILLIIFIIQLNGSELKLRSKIKKLDEATISLASANDWMQKSLAFKRKLISIISHDLIGSLHSLNNTLKYISGSDIEGATQKTILYEVSMSSEQLIFYADDIITWMQFQQQEENIVLDIDRFQLHQLITDKWKVLALRAKMKQVKLFLQIDESYQIKTDRKILGIIIYNILSNAIKFTEKGLVTISATIVRDHIVILFEDTGNGFPDALIADYNDNKVSYIKPKEGTEYELGKGMGLIIIKDLAKQINASINIGNNKAGGAYVCVTIPIMS